MDASTSASDIRRHADALAPVVDALQIGGDRMATGHMSALAAGSLVIDRGVDVVLHLSCRDRNRIALQADILGAAALGISSLILVRGEKLTETTALRAKGVFEIGGTRLIRLAKGLDIEAGLYLGSFVTAFKPADDWQATLIAQKIDAGARFLQTQPCLNVNVLRKYMEKLIEQKVPQRASVIVDVPLLLSDEDVERVKALHKGAPIPAALANRIVTADDPVAEGVSVCAEFLRDLRDVPGVSGANINFSGDSQYVVAAIGQAQS